MTPVFASMADYFRAINIVLSIAYLVWVAVAWRASRTVPRSGVMRQMALNAYVVAAMWASWEMLVATPAPGFRTYLVTLAICWAMCAQAMLHRDNLKRRRALENRSNHQETLP